MKEDICKHCFEPQSEHASNGNWCPRRSDSGHFTSWNHHETFEGINIFKELERLKNWQREAILVLTKWSRVSDFLSKHNLVGLGEDYSTKCLKILESFNHQLSICTLLCKQKDKEIGALTKQLESITGSMAAHPDCVEGSEFYDMVRISEKVLNHEHI